MNTVSWSLMKCQETPPNDGEPLWPPDGSRVWKATWTWEGLPEAPADDDTWITAGEWRGEDGAVLTGITQWCFLHECPDGPPDV